MRQRRRFSPELHLAADAPKRKPRTTNSEHGFPRFENLVEGLEVVRPEQVWVADITYVRLHHEFIYLAVLMDVFTRAIRGWNLGRSLEGALTVLALRRALAQGCPEIHHSDQGVQYAATAYVRRTVDRAERGHQHGGRGQAGGERLRRAADADHQGRGGGPERVRGPGRCPAAVGSVPRRRVQHQADPFLPGVLDPSGVSATMDEHATNSIINRYITTAVLAPRFRGALQPSQRLDGLHRRHLQSHRRQPNHPLPMHVGEECKMIRRLSL